MPFGSDHICQTITSFVYDGWNPIAEFSGTTLSKSYTWGMDLSGGMQDAGGVGGLLAVNETAATYYPTFDGNGNVSEYVDATGTSVAHYEYDAFGQAVASGTKANDFSHQFSTKQLDAETGLHYYGYRYYDSSNGRWLGRDPIQERGGANCYNFVYNCPTRYYDYLGLDPADWGKDDPLDPIWINPFEPTLPPNFDLDPAPVNPMDPLNPFFIPLEPTPTEDDKPRLIGTCDYSCKLKGTSRYGDGVNDLYCDYDCKLIGGTAMSYCPPSLDSSNRQSKLGAGGGFQDAEENCGDGNCPPSYIEGEEYYGIPGPEHFWPNNSKA